MNILLVENEPLVAKGITEKLKLIGYSNTLIVSTVKDALLSIQNTHPEMVLIDIELDGEKDGIELGEYLNQSTQIPFIYLSDLQDTITFERARKTKPGGNLSKPVSPIQLRNTMAHAIELKKTQPTEKYIVINYKSKKIKLDPVDIVYLKAAKNNCEIHILNHVVKRFLSGSPMGNVIKLLNQPHFCQVHRSYVVNLKKVFSYEGGRVFMDAAQTIEIPISPSHLTDFKSRFASL